ncbi:hypothetical protein D3C87_1622870 [compost metagenome]
MLSIADGVVYRLSALKVVTHLRPGASGRTQWRSWRLDGIGITPGDAPGPRLRSKADLRQYAALLHPASSVVAGRRFRYRLGRARELVDREGRDRARLCQPESGRQGPVHPRIAHPGGVSRAGRRRLGDRSGDGHGVPGATPGVASDGFSKQSSTGFI